MTNVAVIYYSSTGSTHQLAQAAADAAAAERAPRCGCAGYPNSRPPDGPAPRSTPTRWRTYTRRRRNDLDWADAVPARLARHFGLAAPQLMQFINTSSPLSIQGKLLQQGRLRLRLRFRRARRPGDDDPGAAQRDLPLGFGHRRHRSADPVLYEKNNGNPYGASTVTGNRTGFIHDENVGAIAYQTRRTIQVAAALKAAAAARPRLTRGERDIMAVSDPARLPSVFVEGLQRQGPRRHRPALRAEAVRVLQPGVVVTGDGRRRATSSFLALGVPIEISLRHTYVYDDTALLIGDFVIDGTKSDGEHIHLEGTATDVARRGSDGLWRYIIDNPPGVEVGGE
ncbi:hypothetical protein GCM10023238_37140 [Streptomyces heliomycini]